MINPSLLKAIDQRHSVRSYTDQPIPQDVADALRAEIARVNAEGGLHIQLVLNECNAFRGMHSYGAFKGVSNYLIMAGAKAPDLEHKLGYYGEQIVLLAQTLGLNTCWVGLTYKKTPGTYQLAEGEKIACAIALGYGTDAGRVRRSKTAETVSNLRPDSPQWFKDAVEAALKAPTAVNQQKFRFDLIADGPEPEVRASATFSLVGYTQMDLGIAKLHFELGAQRPIKFIN